MILTTNNGKVSLIQPKEVKEFKKFLEMVKVNKSKDAKTKAPKRSIVLLM